MESNGETTKEKVIENIVDGKPHIEKKDEKKKQLSFLWKHTHTYASAYYILCYNSIHMVANKDLFIYVLISQNKPNGTSAGINE